MSTAGGPRTALNSRQNPGGLFAVEDSGLSTGTRFYVCSVTGTDAAGFGFGPDTPVATLKYALANLPTASKGDTIYLMEGHTEACIAAHTILCNVAGVNIIGIGKGRLRPVITYTTAAAASFDVTAANVYIKNVVFSAVGVAAVTAAVNVQAADCTFDTCEFELANATNQAALGILTTAAANRLTVTNCFFHRTANAGTAAAIQIVGGDSIRIVNNIFFGAYTSGIGAINNITTATTNCQVGYNNINNITAGCTKALVFVASSSGQINDNNFQILSGTAPITGAGMSWVGYNAYAATIATGTTLV